MGKAIFTNLAGLGSILFLVGLIAAFTLLAVQGAGFPRKNRSYPIAS